MSSCYHCGQPVLQTGFDVLAGTETRQFCCPGCRAVSQLIHGAGMGHYYELRDAPPATSKPVQLEQSFADYVRDFDTYCEVHEGVASTTLFVEGMYCTACSWLVESTLTASPAVDAVSIDALSHRVSVDWRIDELSLAELLSLLVEVGYSPRPLSRFTVQRPELEEQRGALKRLIVASLGMMQVMMFAIGLYAGDAKGIDPQMQHFLRLVSLAVATPVVFYAGRPFFDGALRGLIALRPGMDVPVAIAIGLAYAGSVFSTFTRGDEVWFDSVTMFVFFLTLGRFIEMRARQRAIAETDALQPLLPDTVIVIEDGQQRRRALASLKKDDRLLLRPGDHVPADAVIESGSTLIDESVLTGESRPLSRGPGDAITAGSINLETAVEARATEVGSATVLGSIKRLSRRAMQQRPTIVQTADRIASYFVSAILLLATAVAIVWSNLDPERAFVVTLSVLVVTCPCALALATPAAFAAVSRRMSALNLLLKNSNAIEALSKCTHVVFDKTGTLTLGRPRVVSIETLRTTPGDLQAMQIAAALEASSSHPLALAFAEVASRAEASEVRTVAGLGLEGKVGGHTWRLGRRGFAAGDETLDDGTESALTSVFLGDESGLLAEFRIEDRLRDDAADTIGKLKAAGLQISLLSGDGDESVRNVAATLGIETFRARQTPIDKLDYLMALQARGEKVLMVGDGINDAPVIAGADASIAPAHAADAAQTRADLAMLGERLSPVLDALRLARRTLSVVRQNLLWAVLYNTSAVPLAAMGLVPTWLAALGMSASSLVVVFNSLRLSR